MLICWNFAIGRTILNKFIFLWFQLSNTQFLKSESGEILDVRPAIIFLKNINFFCFCIYWCTPRMTKKSTPICFFAKDYENLNIVCFGLGWCWNLWCSESNLKAANWNFTIILPNLWRSCHWIEVHACQWRKIKGWWLGL